MINLVDLSGKTILIAGASSGIGKQIAITCSQLGARVVLIARNEERLKAVLRELDGSNHCYYVADLGEIEQIEQKVKTIIREQGTLDGMVYTAGVSVDCPLAMSKPNKVENVFRINYFGFLELCRQVTKKGNYNPGMHIVGISSTSSMHGVKSDTIYSSSKGAMNSAMRALARELSDKDICINTVLPGMTDTEMYKKTIEMYGDGHTKELLKRQFRGIIPPSGIANAVAFLLSPASEFITGVALPVDGGLLSS